MNLRKKIKGLLTEAPTGVFHEWKECGNSSGPSVNWDGIGFWVNGPGWNVGTQTGGSPTYPWATHQNSAAFWTFLQQPQQGTYRGVMEKRRQREREAVERRRTREAQRLVRAAEAEVDG